MPITTDFLLLYAELKVNPDTCTLDHFKRAYRRRVAELHPDRAQGKPNPTAMVRLQNLTRLHDEAMRFHDRHGRLPGSNQGAQTGPTDTPPPRAAMAQAEPPRSAARSILIVVLILAGLAVLWLLLPDETGDDTAEPEQVSVAATAAAGQPAVLSVGMDEGDVRRIQGEPAFLSTDVWEYGPSYIRFEKHKVVGWYSSPLYPLKTGTPSRATSKTN
jgi:hypothetical protein